MITKCLTLQSNVNTVLKSSSGPVITIKGKSASLTTIKGFKIQSGGDGIVVSDSDYVKIINNDISGKGNGIVATGTKYLNITKNDIIKNSKSGIVIGNASYAYIVSNNIKNNGIGGLDMAKSSNCYIDKNTISHNSLRGIFLSNKVNGINYGSGPNNIKITKNTISYNGEDGILVESAGDNIQILGNSIVGNTENGISISEIGNNKIQSNELCENGVGLNFKDDYQMPKNQDISYNAITNNKYRNVEAKDTYNYDFDVPLSLGENWYGDRGNICPKIQTKNINFFVKQIGPNQFQAYFQDSKGNIASLLPDRVLNYWTNDGQESSTIMSGGVGVFNVNANNGDMVHAYLDLSRRDNVYDADTQNSKPITGQTPTYSHPNIPNYQLYEDIGKTFDSDIDNGNVGETDNSGGTGNGDVTGEGSGGNTNKGKGVSTKESSSNTGNSTYSQKTDPSSNANNQVNDLSESYETETTTSQASASEASRGNSGTPGVESQSVVKQILMDEDEFFRVTGISLIVLLMILTVGFYLKMREYLDFCKVEDESQIWVYLL